MRYTNTVLDEVQDDIQPSDGLLGEARSRRDALLTEAMRFEGATRRFNSGSLGHGTANQPKQANGEVGQIDADCGVVLSSKTYPELGPIGEGPSRVVEKMRVHLRDALKDSWPDAAFRVTKRAIKVTFKKPMSDGSDPTVDLIVGLDRAQGGLWIPNTEQERWDPSDPEKHTELLVGGGAGLRRVRARACRLGKAWNSNYSRPGMCSFNLEALSLGAIEDGMTLPEALRVLFEFARDDLKKHLTQDPAGVSGSIKLPLDRDVVVDRLDRAARWMTHARDNDDDENQVREALSHVFPAQVDAPVGRSSKASIASALRGGNDAIAARRGQPALPGVGAISAPTTSSWTSDS